MHPLLQLSLACSIIAGCSTQNRLSIPDPRYCYYKGKWYEHGSVFQDKCNTCWCYYGSVGCTDINCGEKPGVYADPPVPSAVFYSCEHTVLVMSLSGRLFCRSCYAYPDKTAWMRTLAWSFVG
ncbi:hypothetical protein DPMN_143115 [Dreissena polymorpha]|uniref:VWFC domain-containing protein n=1 Tax=Dreissena polymorpha TaxID=45954 RepID=A0A9D4JJS6_DREPO|nr:hypothetical protein DPMN_143115 [Dreissena polymorpha]